MATNEVEVKSAFRRYDKANGIFKKYYFDNIAEQVECKDGMTTEEKIGDIKGITTSTDMVNTGWCLDATIGKNFSDTLNIHEQDISDLKEKVETNTQNIAINTQNISTNAEDITDLKNNVKINSDNIYKHDKRIFTNENDISDLKNNVIEIKNDISNIKTQLANNFLKVITWRLPQFTVKSHDWVWITFDASFENYLCLGVVGYNTDKPPLTVAHVIPGAIRIYNHADYDITSSQNKDACVTVLYINNAIFNVGFLTKDDATINVETQS